jgi:hypothetical protein
MQDRETPTMHTYGERKTTQIVMATLRHVTSGSGLRKFEADGFLLNSVYKLWLYVACCVRTAILNLVETDQLLLNLKRGA